MARIPRLKAYDGPAILSYGFRPFFLVGTLYAGLSILAFAWAAAFPGFAMSFGPSLMSRRPSGAVT
jgi:uncharacterized protein involved in response to NO